MNPVILKDVQEMPDHYSLKINTILGNKKEFEIVGHSVSEGMLKLMTKDEIIHWIPISNIEGVEFDKRLNKILELKAKHDQGK